MLICGLGTQVCPPQHHQKPKRIYLPLGKIQVRSPQFLNGHHGYQTIVAPSEHTTKQRSNYPVVALHRRKQPETTGGGRNNTSSNRNSHSGSRTSVGIAIAEPIANNGPTLSKANNNISSNNNISNTKINSSWRSNPEQLERKAKLPGR